MGRDANSLGNGVGELPQYKAENFEMYGPLWIFVTLVIEFIILGHLSNQLSTQTGHSEEMLSLLVQKNTSNTLQRIMRIVLILGLFYIGWPSTTYLMIKGANGMEVTFMHQLSMFSYAFVPQIPISILIFSL